MRLLLDTHAALWWVDDAPSLSRRARAAIADPANECLFSVASVWEMAIKQSLGKLSLTTELREFVSRHFAGNGFRELAIELTHVARVARLPFHHRDPFDRLLAAQAACESLAIVSRDAVFRRYGVERVW
jgi:PIN domain nuclease of toxin-antitoxin system